MKMRNLSVGAVVSAIVFAVMGAEEADVVVYGSTPGGIAAAVQAKRMGRSVVLLEPTDRIGGLTTGGLGQTDIGNKAAFGGIARSFYADIAKHYAKDGSWRWEKRTDYLPDGQCAGTKGSETMWTFEPSAALAVLTEWERREGIRIVRNAKLDREKGKVKVEEVEVEGRGRQRRIISFVTEDGTEYRGKMFVDATYEGDLMAAAGVTYFVGREANAVYGETISGNAPQARGSGNHNFRRGVDPHVVKGDPKSGLLPGVEPYNPSERPGDGDRRVQAYCFRMCLTDVPENRIPFAKPAGYDERDYELLFRNFEAGESADGSLPWINSKMPNRKTDTNTRTGFSTDFVGGNWAWPEASYAERERILKAHLDYQRGLMWTLANHPRVPERVRREISRWGTCRDEFTDGLGDGWQRQLYVREARRLVGETVMTEHHCRGTRTVERPVALGAYGMDSHNVRRRVSEEGFVRNEGNVEDYRAADGKTRFKPFGIDYGALVPKRGECANLLVPVCLSASHMAFGSIRMEPVFFALGQVAGTAAVQAIVEGVAVQDVRYEALRDRLVSDGQVLRWK